MWDNVIRKAQKKVSMIILSFELSQRIGFDFQVDRSYSVALALEFEAYVVTFLSLDQVFQVFYSVLLLYW